MTIETKISPPNSLLLITDQDSDQIPESMDGKLVAATPSSIAIGTLCQSDGKTSVVMTDEPLLPGVAKGV